MDCINPGPKTKNWRTAVNTVMNIPAPNSLKNFLAI